MVDRPRGVDGLDKRLPVLVTVIAVILLTQSMAQLTWKLVPVQPTHNSQLRVLVAPKSMLMQREACIPLTRSLRAKDILM